MNRARFDDYIRRFNARDTTAFDEFLAPHMHTHHGTLTFDGVQGMKDHYAKIWPTFTEWPRDELFASILVAYNSFISLAWTVRRGISAPLARHIREERSVPFR
jgi:hypothetical protein